MYKLDYKVSDVLDNEMSDGTIIRRKDFRHKSFEERMMEFSNEISVCDFEWDEPQGRELI